MTKFVVELTVPDIKHNTYPYEDLLDWVACSVKSALEPWVNDDGWSITSIEENHNETKVRELQLLLADLVDAAYDSGYYSGSEKYQYTEVHTDRINQRNALRKNIERRLEDLT